MVPDCYCNRYSFGGHLFQAVSFIGHFEDNISVTLSDLDRSSTHLIDDMERPHFGAPASVCPVLDVSLFYTAPHIRLSWNSLGNRHRGRTVSVQYRVVIVMRNRGIFQRTGSALAAMALLSACGGGGGSSNSNVSLPTSANGGTPTPTPSSACSLRARQDWVAAQMDTWYLFPETLPANLNPAAFSSVQTYLDGLTETARNQGRDRFFTFITSIADENAFLQSGATAGFGIRLSYDTDQSRLFVVEAFENAPAFAAGLDRGSEITGIGTATNNIQSVTSLFAQGGSSAVSDALGPSTSGTSRVLRFTDAAGTEMTTTVTKATFSIRPLSTRYGVRIIEDRGRKIGYLNLRTFINSADSQLRDAFGQFRAEGVTELIVDFRYNGGGLVATADLMGDLMGRGRFASDTWSITRYRPSRSNNDETRNFQSEAQSIAPTKIAFIGTGGTASASELVINSMKSYLDADIALIGTDTFGKPVGQIGLDRAQCDDRLRVVAFAKQNADGEGDYYDGLANTLPRTCRADDDFATPLGDPAESSVAQALDFLAGESCTPIAPAGAKVSRGGQVAANIERQLLMPNAPNPAQREVPGTF